jgi:hypothetical protein
MIAHSVILGTQVEIRRIVVQGQPDKKLRRPLSQPITARDDEHL